MYKEPNVKLKKLVLIFSTYNKKFDKLKDIHTNLNASLNYILLELTISQYTVPPNVITITNTYCYNRNLILTSLPIPDIVVYPIGVYCPVV